MAIDIITGSLFTMFTIVTWQAEALIFVLLHEHTNTAIFAQVRITTGCDLTCWATKSTNTVTLKCIYC